MEFRCSVGSQVSQKPNSFEVLFKFEVIVKIAPVILIRSLIQSILLSEKNFIFCTSEFM